jgi:hypothetical protein
MAWMTAGAAIAITSGIIAIVDRSRARPGLGDRVRGRRSRRLAAPRRRQPRTRKTRALRLIGVTFSGLAACLAIERITDLVSQTRPELSSARIAVTAAALVVMPLLAIAKRRTGQMLGNRTLIADAARARSAPSPPLPRCSDSGSTPDSDGGGPTQRGARHRRAGGQGRHRSLGRRPRMTR